MTTNSKAALELKRLRECAGFSVRGMAAALRNAGSKYGRSPSSYAYYENDFRKPYLPLDLVEALIPLFLDKGDPPIVEREILALAGTGRNSLWIARPRFTENSVLSSNGIVDPDLLSAVLEKIEHAAAERSVELTSRHIARMAAEVYARLSGLQESQQLAQLDQEVGSVFRLAQTFLNEDSNDLQD